MTYPEGRGMTDKAKDAALAALGAVCAAIVWIDRATRRGRP